MAPEHFHRPARKRLDTPISASHFRAKLKITFALLIAQMERNHAISLSAGPAAPQKRPNAAIEQAGDNEEPEQYPYEFKGIYDQIADVVAGRGDALVPGDGRLVTDLSQQPFGIVRTGRREDHCHQRTGSFCHGAGNPLEIHKTFTGDLRGGVREDGQPQFSAGSLEVSQLGFSTQMEGGGRGRNAGTELLQAN